MIRSLLMLLFASLALAGCKQQAESKLDVAEASPILYQLSGSDGKSKAWLFGTIHALPDGTKWRTDRLQQAVKQADTLVVEIANLADNQALARTFVAYATTPGQPDLSERVSREERPALFDLIGQSSYRASDFGDIETWAAALMLSPSDDADDSKNGADRALIAEFAGRNVVELEGADKQFAIFDSLPEADQVDLLLGVIEESETRKQDPDRLRRAWLIGDATTLEAAMETGILADPELRATLLVERNRDWSGQIDALIKSGKKPLVAVGTAHLLGPDGLVRLLTAKGYSLERVQ